MSRVSLIDQLYQGRKKSALEFDYDALMGPPIKLIFDQWQIDRFYEIATSARLSGDIGKKRNLIDELMRSRDFRFMAAGTNRVVYRFLEDPTFIAKVGVDRAGIKDSPAEYINQNYFKPFCTKVFDVSQTGAIGFIERVNPITSIEEFLSVSDDIFNMMTTKIMGKYVFDDLGVSKYMNYGIRYNTATGCTFGPVVIDFPYIYELDIDKTICRKKIKSPFGLVECGGEIDYNSGLDQLYCTKCGKIYDAIDLRKEHVDMPRIYTGNGGKMNRVRIISGDGKVISDSGRSSNTYVSKEEYDAAMGTTANKNEQGTRIVPVSKIRRIKRKTLEQHYKEENMKLRQEVYRKMRAMEEHDTGGFNPVVRTKTSVKATPVKQPATNNIEIVQQPSSYKKIVARTVTVSGDPVNEPIINPATEYESLVAGLITEYIKSDSETLYTVDENDFDSTNDIETIPDEYEVMYNELTDEQKEEVENV